MNDDNLAVGMQDVGAQHTRVGDVGAQHAAPLLDVTNLTIVYRIGRQWIPAVRDVHLAVQAGEIHGLVGESGSGKSTLALGILRYLSPNARIEAGSRILFDGQDLTQVSPQQLQALWAKRIKLVPQNPSAALNPSMKVGWQAAEGLGLAPLQARQAVLEMFQKVRLPDPDQVYERYPHQLSGGMQQRVVIGMALLTNPDLLIMDEPTTGLDVTTEAAILDLIRELIQQQGSAVLYVTHNLGVVAQLCQRLTVLYGGEVMVNGAVKDIFQRTYHPYPLGLLQSLPRLGQTKYQSALMSIEGHPPSLQNLPPGCVFAPRCFAATNHCHHVKPSLEQTPDGRMIRCHRWREIAEGTLSLEQTIKTGITEDKRADNPRLLSVTEITKHFDAPQRLRGWLLRRPPAPIRAVDGVNLAIQKGRTLGLVGESGSGKTTLSRLMVGLVEKTAGTIDLLGVEMGPVHQRRPADLARMQMIFQNPQQSLNPYLTVGQALRRPLMKLRGLTRPQAEVEALKLLAAVNLRQEYAQRYPDALSGGEKQRVAIARAFASHPDIVIADEPVSALDVSVQSAVLNLLAQLQEDYQTAYLFISHDLAVIGYLADYVAVMYLGQLVEVGYTKDVFNPPLHPYTEALLAAIPNIDPSLSASHPPLQGDPPSAQALPRGCRFHTRCPHKLGPLCEGTPPPWQSDSDEHYIRCHIPIAELQAMQGRGVFAELAELKEGV
jgi:peptide/nickel transport system ATP-binding protein